MSYHCMSRLVLLFSLLVLTPLSAFPEQTAHPRSQQQRVSGRLIPPRPFTVSKASMDHLARTPRKAPDVLTVQDNAAVKDIVTAILARDVESATSRWSSLVTALDQRRMPADVSELIQFVLRETYLQSYLYLQNCADKIKSFNDLRKQVRDEIAKLRQKRRTLSAEKSSQVERDDTSAQLADSIKKLEEKLVRIDDDAQLANIDLQNALQKQQQLIQMISNVSKIMYETSMQVIRKIG